LAPDREAIYYDNELKQRDETVRWGSNDTKRDMTKDQHDVYRPDADRDECICHREQFAWCRVNGKAIYICYEIYDLPGSKDLALPSGLRKNRSEFGIQITLPLTFLHYRIHLSSDNARAIMQLVTGLAL